MKNFKQQLKDLLEKEGLKCTIEETDNGLLVVEKKGRRRAEKNEYYWYITDLGYISKAKELFSSEDHYRYHIQNYFFSMDDAEDGFNDQIKLGQFLDYILELKDQGFKVQFQATDIKVAELITKKFGAVSLF